MEKRYVLIVLVLVLIILISIVVVLNLRFSSNKNISLSENLSNLSEVQALSKQDLFESVDNCNNVFFSENVNDQCFGYHHFNDSCHSKGYNGGKIEKCPGYADTWLETIELYDLSYQESKEFCLRFAHKGLAANCLRIIAENSSRKECFDFAGKDPYLLAICGFEENQGLPGVSPRTFNGLDMTLNRIDCTERTEWRGVSYSIPTSCPKGYLCRKSGSGDPPYQGYYSCYKECTVDADCFERTPICGGKLYYREDIKEINELCLDIDEGMKQRDEEFKKCKEKIADLKLNQPVQVEIIAQNVRGQIEDLEAIENILSEKYGFYKVGRRWKSSFVVISDAESPMEHICGLEYDSLFRVSHKLDNFDFSF